MVERHENQSFYDFLIEEPEMMAPAPPGHNQLQQQQQQQQQQAISPLNRTRTIVSSRDLPPRQGPTELQAQTESVQTHHHAINHHHATPSALAATTTTTNANIAAFGRQHLPLQQQPQPQSRAESRAPLHIDLDGAHSLGNSHRFHNSPNSHLNANINHGAHSTAHPGMSAAGPFSTSIPPTSAGSMTVDWGIYENAHPNLAIHPASFDFELPGLAVPPVPAASAGPGAIGHHGQFPHTSNDVALGFGNDMISPSTIHAQRGHYSFDDHWDGDLAREASTSKVATPMGTVTSNPWADLDDGSQQGDQSKPLQQPKRVSRSKRQRKETRKASEASIGGSSSTGGPAMSISDPPSPSSASQHSRASIGSKSASIASTASTTSSRQPKLRSASRTSKNSHAKPHDTPEERRTRASHNLVEKQYRNRLNAQFESLLNSLPEQLRAGNTSNGGDESDGNDQDRRVSKGEVLEMARKHIQTLEQERSELERERNELQGNLKRLKDGTSEDSSSSRAISQGPRLSSEIDVDVEESSEAGDGSKN